MAQLTAGEPSRAEALRMCESEPIHLSGSIQPLGDLIAVDPGDLRIVQAAITPGSPIFPENPVGEFLSIATPEYAEMLIGAIPHLTENGPLHVGGIRSGSGNYDVVAHRSGATLVYEFEEAATASTQALDPIYQYVRDFLNDLHSVSDIGELAFLAAREVRRITGLDRALVYRFDEEWNGEVIAEDGNGRLPSYLGLRFPASDIPAQARRLYHKNRLRMIASSDYLPVPIQPAVNPIDGAPLDLTFSVLRSVSPVHLQYMRNMSTAASMSISLMRGDRLWGLISCHGASPSRVPYHIRSACDFIGQILSLQLVSKETAASADLRLSLRAVQRRLLSSMAASDQFIDGLTSVPGDLLSLTGSSGAAVVADGSIRLLGETPLPDQIRRIVEWLSSHRKEDIFASAHLAAEMPGADEMKDSASGIVAISISQMHDSFVIWFRPETLKIVSWGGDPAEKAQTDPLHISPRKSFEAWRETVRLRSEPWSEAEIDAAFELRTAIVDIVLRKAEELAALAERLAETNKELEAFSYSISHDLRAPFRHIVGYAQLLGKFEAEHVSEKGRHYIDTIIESGLSAGTLVDNLLSFSQMGRSTLNRISVDAGSVLEGVRRRMAPGETRSIVWNVGSLPRAYVDPTMLRLVYQNLIENAVKFSRGREPAVIDIGYAEDVDGGAYFVRDNGVGFDMAYAGKLFGVFQRLHRVEEFEGTGIGLANVKRIVERHNGKVWAEGKVGAGATFYFSLPSFGA
jgi:chemotaxis family two-component system sensor kinase Cph1